MKYSTLVILMLFFTVFAKAQGNLQFNRIITLTTGQNYTVPSDKCLKIESISYNNLSVERPLIGNKFTTTACIYGSVPIFTVGSITFESGQVEVGGDGICAPPTTPATRVFPVNISGLSFPIWLESGRQVSIPATTNGIMISCIEFNLIP